MILRLKGGEGSGNHGHQGIPGHRGGSASGHASITLSPKERNFIMDAIISGSDFLNRQMLVKGSNDIELSDDFVEFIKYNLENLQYGSMSASENKILRNIMAKITRVTAMKGGEGSGNFGHAGRPGRIGGSTKGKFAGKKANPAGVDTMTQYQYPDGSWTQERQALHNKIIASFFVGKTPVDNPTSYVLGGAGAVGKTTFTENGGIPDSLNAVKADSDAIKFMLPEFEKGITGSETFNPAVFCHEESAYLSKKIAAKAASEGYNVILDGTGDSSIESLTAKVNSLRSRGQKVNGVYLTCDINTALARSQSRFAKSGRIVPKALFMATHARVSRVFPDIVKANLYDKIDLYDTSSGSATLIATGNMHSFTIINHEAYQAFLDKAKS